MLSQSDLDALTLPDTVSDFREYSTDFERSLLGLSPPRLIRQDALCHNSTSILDSFIHWNDNQPEPNENFTLPTEKEEEDLLDISPNSDEKQAQCMSEVSTIAEPASTPTEERDRALDQSFYSDRRRTCPTQVIDEAFLQILRRQVNIDEVKTAFQSLGQKLLDCETGDCRAYHSILNEWLCARLSRVAAAQMMVQFFANGCQVCYIFREVSGHGFSVRYTKSCIRTHNRQR